MIEGKSRNREDVIDRLIDDSLAKMSIVPLVRYKCTNTTKLDKTGLTESSCTHSSRLPAQQTLIDIFTTTCCQNTGLRFAAILINNAVSNPNPKPHNSPSSFLRVSYLRILWTTTCAFKLGLKFCIRPSPRQ